MKKCHCLLLPALAVSSFLMTAPSFAAQTGVDSILAQVEQLYDSGSFLSAELEARRTLELEGISDSIKVQLDKVIAFSLVAQGKNKGAVERFLMILRHAPEFDLDPVFTAPKILQAFYEAKQMNSAAVKAKLVLPMEEGKRSGLIVPRISFRALLFPGWEQLHQDRLTSGYIFLTAGSVTAGAAVVSSILKNSARSNYLSASTSADAEKRYERYNNLNKIIVYSLSAFVVAYLASQVDVVLTPVSAVSGQEKDEKILSGAPIPLIGLSFPL